MATNTTALPLELRGDSGSSSARKARHLGNVPGVLYGHGQPPVAISVNGKALGELLHGRRQNMLDIVVNGTNDTAIIRDMQLDPVTRRVMSIDFQRVSRSEIITAEVTIITVGVPLGVREQGGVMDVLRHEVEVSGPADKIPDELRVDVTNLAVGEHITASQIELPEGFKIVTAADTTILAIESSKTEKEAEADLTQATPEGGAAPAEGAAAPGGAAAS